MFYLTIDSETAVNVHNGTGVIAERISVPRYLPADWEVAVTEYAVLRSKDETSDPSFNYMTCDFIDTEPFGSRDERLLFNIPLPDAPRLIHYKPETPNFKRVTISLLDTVSFRMIDCYGNGVQLPTRLFMTLLFRQV